MNVKYICQQYGKQKLLSVVLIFMGLLSGGCSDENSDLKNRGADGELQAVRISPQEVNNPDGKIIIDSLNAYVFTEGRLQKVFKNLTPDETGNYVLYAYNNSRVYFGGNMNGTAALETLEEGTTSQTDFLSLRSEKTADNSARLFYSGEYDLTSVGGTSAPVTVEVPLTRSIANLNLNTSRDENIKVTRIIVGGVPATTTLFPGETPVASNAETTEYDLTFEPAITSQDDILSIYESDSPIDVTVYATYKDIPQAVKLALPVVKRNFKYTIELEGVGTTISSTLRIVPWGEGGRAQTSPDQTGRIMLDGASSVLPEGVTVYEAADSVAVSENGGEIVLAFASDITAELDRLEGNGEYITLVPKDTLVKDGKVISRFLLTVKPQGKGRLGYQAILHMKRAFQQFSYDVFSIRVAASSFPIPEVTIGGVTWMAFNATTRELDDQIYLSENETVGDAYRNRWGEVLGGFFQWGRIHMYTPWLAGKDNEGNQAHNAPWVDEAYVPCPEGYRIPTKSELTALLPYNQAIPGSYTYNGETITAELIYTPEKNITIGGVSGLARFMRLTSSSGAELYIPLVGRKGDKSTAKNPNFGQGFSLWSSQNNGATGGWAWNACLWIGLDESGKMQNTSQFQAEAYGSLRCLKNNIQ